jgi:hypothetical protein
MTAGARREAQVVSIPPVCRASITTNAGSSVRSRIMFCISGGNPLNREVLLPIILGADNGRFVSEAKFNKVFWLKCSNSEM